MTTNNTTSSEPQMFSQHLLHAGVNYKSFPPQISDTNQRENSFSLPQTLQQNNNRNPEIVRLNNSHYQNNANHHQASLGVDKPCHSDNCSETLLASDQQKQQYNHHNNDCHMDEEPTDLLLMRHLLQQQEREKIQQSVQEQQQLRHQMQNQQQQLRRQLESRHHQEQSLLNHEPRKKPWNLSNSSEEINANIHSFESISMALQQQSQQFREDDRQQSKEIKQWAKPAPIMLFEKNHQETSTNPTIAPTTRADSPQGEDNSPNLVVRQEQKSQQEPMLHNKEHQHKAAVSQQQEISQQQPNQHQLSTSNLAESQSYFHKDKQPESQPKVRTSNFIGVHWHRGAKKWVAQISIDSKRTHLGYFSTELEAAKRYDIKAKQLGRPINQYDSTGKDGCVVVGATSEYTKGPYNKRRAKPAAKKPLRKSETSTKSREQKQATPEPPQSSVVFHQAQCEHFDNVSDNSMPSNDDFGNDDQRPVTIINTFMVDKEVQTIPAFTMVTISRKRKSPDNPRTSTISNFPPPQPPTPSPYRQSKNRRSSEKSNYGLGSLMDLAETASTRAFAVPVYMPPPEEKVVFV